jgi:hypothetical protein
MDRTSVYLLRVLKKTKNLAILRGLFFAETILKQIQRSVQRTVYLAGVKGFLPFKTAMMFFAAISLMSRRASSVALAI